MTTYRIRDWSKHFENNRTRELKELRFVILPNKHDGDGYTELLDHPNGAAHYGAWCALVQVASKGQHPAEDCENPAGCCECRGVLLRDGARAHDPASLSRLTRIPPVVFEEVLPRLLTIGWIEVVNPQTQPELTDSEIPHPPAASTPSESRTPLRKSDTEWNGMEGNGRGGGRARKQRAPETPPPDSFPITEDMRAWAESRVPGVDVNDQTERFLDKSREKAWTAVDWAAKWRTWMKNAKRYADEDAKKNGSEPPRTPTLREKLGVQL